jgi:hypothetical protein
MSAKTKACVILGVLGAIVGLAWICQSNTDRPISVVLKPVPHVMCEHDAAKIVLKAEVNGSSLSHGEVRLEFACSSPTDMASVVNHRFSIEGYTDPHGVFIAHWSPPCPGEYMIVAEVKKPGRVTGQTVCFVRVVEKWRSAEATTGL